MGSPLWRKIDLGRYGLTWKWAEIDCGHPLDDGSAGVLYQSVEQTAAGMGSDGWRWRLAVGDLVTGFEDLGQDLLRPLLHVPRHLMRLAAFGPRALLPATTVARWFRTEQARAVFGGAAALSGHGGAITTGVTVASRSDIPDADAVMLDLTPAAAVAIYGDVMPVRIKRSYRRYREGSSAFKVDFAIEGHIPWINPDCGRAGMVHLGGTFAEIAHTERLRADGRMAERPFTLVGQQYLADRSRSAGKINPIRAYAQEHRAVRARFPGSHHRDRQQGHR